MYINIIRRAVTDQAGWRKDGKAGTFLSYPTRPPPTLTVPNTVGMGGGSRSTQPTASPPPKARAPDHTG